MLARKKTAPCLTPCPFCCDPWDPSLHSSPIQICNCICLESIICSSFQIMHSYSITSLVLIFPSIFHYIEESSSEPFVIQSTISSFIWKIPMSKKTCCNATKSKNGSFRETDTDKSAMEPETHQLVVRRERETGLCAQHDFTQTTKQSFTAQSLSDVEKVKMSVKGRVSDLIFS